MSSKHEIQNEYGNERGNRTSDLPSQPVESYVPRYHCDSNSPYYQVDYGLPYNLDQVIVVQTQHVTYSPRSDLTTAFLCILLGLFGIHHFYLNNFTLATAYISTLGLFGIGWIVDWFRIPCLVKKCNEGLKEEHDKGHYLVGRGRFIGPLQKTSLLDAYLLWLPPLGLFGFHHYYLGRTLYGFFQIATMGANVLSWFVDLFRMPWLVRKANEDITKMKAGITVERLPFSVLDAYLLGILFGFLGLHHFYLGNKERGIIYLLSFGVLGLGWLVDLLIMPSLVSKANKEREEAATRPHNQPQGRVSVVPAQQQATVSYHVEPPPTYDSHNISENISRHESHAPTSIS